MSRFPSAALCAMLIAAIPAFAQDQSPSTQAPAAQQGSMMRGNMQGMQGMRGDMQGMRGMQGMGPMQGQHVLAATVTNIDGKSGIVDVSADSMTLKLHFPPSSLTGLKAGDKITVHLAFQKA